MIKILLVEDDRDLCDVIMDWLELEEYQVEAVFDGEQGRARLSQAGYDLCILDWDLPKLNGIDLCREYRGSGGQLPILMLTGKLLVDDKESGLDSGADDYLTKPFDVKELSARLRALLRRPARVLPSNLLTFQDIAIDTVNRRVTRGEVVIPLHRTEYALLEYLVRNEKKVLRAEDLKDYLWPSGSDTGDSALRMTVKRLRQKIDYPGQDSVIENIKSVGYRLRSG